MSDTQTEGMIKLPDGSYLGSVGITLTPKDIEEADYTGGTSTNVTSEKIITALSEIENKIEAGVTTLIASSNLNVHIPSAFAVYSGISKIPFFGA